MRQLLKNLISQRGHNGHNFSSAGKRKNNHSIVLCLFIGLISLQHHLVKTNTILHICNCHGQNLLNCIHAILQILPVAISLQTWKNSLLEKYLYQMRRLLLKQNAYFAKFKNSYFLEQLIKLENCCAKCT